MKVTEIKGNNINNILENIEQLINHIDSQQYSWNKRIYISNVCENLSIFDWWKDTLSKSQLKDMKRFLVTAQKLGFNGYVCFKVGASGCANGMWAHKELSTDGCSPQGACLYKSFTPSYNYWSVNKDGTDFDSTEFKTVKELKNFLGK